MLQYLRFLVTANLLFLIQYSKAQTAATIVLTNPLAVERKDELMVFAKEILEQKLGKIQPGKFVVFSKANKQPLLVQYDDMNGDGNWDEAVFLYSFKQKEHVVLNIMLSDHPATLKAVVRAHVRLRKKDSAGIYGPLLDSEIMPLENPATDFSIQPISLYSTEGPAWENDKVAFRQYLDIRSGKDIFGKRITHMVMDSVGDFYKTYHQFDSWGMDVLHVGKSLGAGAIALKIKSKGKDTLIRVGGLSMSKTMYNQVSNGPVRAIFRMTYNWTVNGKPIKIIDETSIWGGQYFYQSKVMIEGAPAGAQLVTGFADFNNMIARKYMSKQSAIIFSHGSQSDNKDILAMGIIADKKVFAGFGRTPDAGSDILNTYTVAQHIKQEPLLYRFYAAWEKTDQRFANIQYFEKYLQQEAQKISQPIIKK